MLQTLLSGKAENGGGERKAAPQEATQGPAGCIFKPEGTVPLPFRHAVERTQADFFDSLPLVAMEIVSHPPILKNNNNNGIYVPVDVFARDAPGPLALSPSLLSPHQRPFN